MKKKSFLLVFIVVCLVVSNVFAAGCSKTYRTDCDGCNHAITTFGCTAHRVSSGYYDDCPDVANCDIIRKETVHVMICRSCRIYGDGAYNLEDYTYYHTKTHTY